ncbi:MAG TPA: DNA-binding response regulator [Clostridiaceae bacterium]|nr:DNA-binding response regulator [Clostridiaceae bacterium]
MYKIVIAEDEDIIRKGLVYSINWAELGCSVVADVKNGVEGVEAIRKYSPEIVIADINMPVMAGLEMFEKTHDTNDYSAIILSGYSSFEYAQKAIELGVLGYLSKPLDIDELREVILKAKKDIELRNLVQKNIMGTNELKNIDLFKDAYGIQYDNDLVDQMLQFIFENYDKKIVMRDVIEKFNYSETYLNRKFKETVGTTFNEYLNRYRIQKAIELLVKEKEMSIQEISWKCGISDYKYFGSVFKKYVGCGPKEYLAKIHK